MSIIAWRVWNVREAEILSWRPLRRRNRNPSLFGSHGVTWPTSHPLVAACILYRCCSYCEPSPKHEDFSMAPDINCTCGIYALKNPADCENYSSVGSVIGVVELWGKIIPAEFGYRAQKGQIRALINAPENVIAAYNVPNFPSIDYARREYFSSTRKSEFG